MLLHGISWRHFYQAIHKLHWQCNSSCFAPTLCFKFKTLEFDIQVFPSFAQCVDCASNHVMEQTGVMFLCEGILSNAFLEQAMTNLFSVICWRQLRIGEFHQRDSSRFQKFKKLKIYHDWSKIIKLFFFEIKWFGNLFWHIINIPFKFVICSRKIQTNLRLWF